MSSASPSAKPSPGHPVVLVHGIWDTRRTLHRLDAALRAAGHRTVVVELRPNDATVPLDDYAHQVHAQIHRQVIGEPGYSIVGFSMGGLVARAYLRAFAEPERVRAFVSIASPHRGTWTAYLRSGAGVRDMRPGSAFLARLDADAARFHATRWTTIRTPFDLMILPSRSSELAWARNERLAVPAHPLLVWDRRVIRRVLAALAE